MKIPNLLLTLAILLVFVSCGTQKASVKSTDNQPLIQNKFLGVQFGNSPRKVYQRISRFRPTRESDGSYTIMDQSFAGTNWHFVQMSFVDELLYVVNFQQEFKHENLARKRFENIHSMLQVKYGDMKMTESENGFIFTDAEDNKVSITVHLGTSRGGEDYWYCELTYYWGGGILLNYLKSIHEL